MSQYLKVQEERDLGISDERPSPGRGNSRWKGGGEAVGGVLEGQGAAQHVWWEPGRTDEANQVGFYRETSVFSFIPS